MKQYMSRLPLACNTTLCCARYVCANTNDLGYCGLKSFLFFEEPCPPNGWLNQECKMGPLILKQVCWPTQLSFPKCVCCRKHESKLSAPPAQENMGSEACNNVVMAAV